MPSPALDAPAPDFTLPGVQLVDGKPVLADYTVAAQRGAPVVLAFYPGDNTPVCTRQMCSYSSGLEEFAGLGAQVWGISTQSVDSHVDFATKHALTLPLLADTGSTAIAAYGVGGPLGTQRSVFVVDVDGVLRWKHVAKIGLTYKGTKTLTGVLRTLTPA